MRRMEDKGLSKGTMPLGMENLIRYSLLATGYNPSPEPPFHWPSQWGRNSADLFH